MFKHIFWSVFFLFFYYGSSGGERVIYIENESIRLGVNLDMGGSITYLSASGEEENIINSFDMGRQIQMSFYSGPVPYIPESGQKPHESWEFLGWNPIQSGDVGGNRSEVVDYYHGEDSIYVKTIPMHWPLNNVPGHCFFESHIKIESSHVKVESRLLNHRRDTIRYPARSQELPAVYVNGPYHRLVTYKGTQPFQQDRISEIPQLNETRPEWSYWQATENWAAHLNDENFGLGVVTPEVQSYIGGFSGKKGSGGPRDAPTGYCAPILREILDHDIAYGYSYYLVVGHLEDIRNFAYRHRPAEKKISFQFEKDRDHVYYTNATDTGWPVQDALAIIPRGEEISVNSPALFFPVKENFTFKLNALFPGDVEKVRLVCPAVNQKDAMSYELAVEKDNLFHTYRFYLKNRRNEDFFIGQVKLEVVYEASGKNRKMVIKEFGLE